MIIALDQAASQAWLGLQAELFLLGLPIQSLAWLATQKSLPLLGLAWLAMRLGLKKQAEIKPDLVNQLDIVLKI